MKIDPVHIDPVEIDPVEIETLTELAALLADADRSVAGVTLQDLNLTDSRELAARLADRDLTGLVVLGGHYPDALLAAMVCRGATVLPTVPGVPFDPYRSALYRATELYANLENGYPATPDARYYRWYLQHQASPDIPGAMFAGIHDTSITDALDELLAAADRPLVAVMGGHGTVRGSADYAVAADLGLRLSHAGAVVATGGGPGAMEAVNLGAGFGGRGRSDLDAALQQLGAVPSFTDVAGWARSALEIADTLTGETLCSIGVPTWFYGHEPPNVFADRIAKYFSNALREEVLLARATGGVVVLPGAAGTVQEIFQAATRNYYAAGALPPPMVLVGNDYWRTTLPAWPLLQRLAAGRPMADRIAVCDTAEDAVRLLAGW
ncbi:MAG: LOG family protein [Actinomycetota bacterium]|nr:LOG family protein [Actinomycetota bacterium]